MWIANSSGGESNSNINPSTINISFVTSLQACNGHYVINNYLQRVQLTVAHSKLYIQLTISHFSHSHTTHSRQQTKEEESSRPREQRVQSTEYHCTIQYLIILQWGTVLLTLVPIVNYCICKCYRYSKYL